MELFKLVGKIFVDSQEAEGSISKVGDKADGLGDKLAKGIGTAAKWGAGIAAAATAVGGAMVAAAKDTASALDTIDKGSQRMKISAESYQELAYAANLSGVEMSTLEKAAKKLEGTDLSFDEAIDQIMSLGTEAERSAAASELFGESVAYQMTPLLNAGADGLKAMTDEAHSLGLVMSQDSVTSGAAMNDMFTKLQATFAQVKNTIMVDLMPYVMEILQWLTDNLPLVAETVQKVMDKLMPIIEPILHAVMDLFQSVFSLISGDFDGFAEGIKSMFSNLGEAMVTIGSNIINFLKDGMAAAWSGITSWVTEKVQWVKDQFNGSALVGGVKNIVGGLFSHASGLPYVPYDGYQATLHKGETILNSTDASQLLNKMEEIASNSKDTSSGPIEISLNIDGQTFARATYKFNESESTRRGKSLIMA